MSDPVHSVVFGSRGSARFRAERGGVDVDRGHLGRATRSSPRARAHAASRPPRRAERARRHAALEGCRRRRHRDAARHGLLRPEARADLRGDPHALLARRADRRRRGHGRAHQDRRAAARRRRRLPAHAHLDRADGGERRLLRVDRQRARAAAPTRRRRHAHRADGVLGPGRGARPRQQRAGRDLLGHGHRGGRGLRPAHDRRRRRRRRDRGGPRSRRSDDRHPDRLLGSRPAHQRAAPRADDHHRGATRDG